MSDNSAPNSAGVAPPNQDAILKQLASPPPAEFVKEKQGYSYVSIFYVTKRANEVFGTGGWKVEIVHPPTLVWEGTRQVERTRNGQTSTVENLVAIYRATVRVHALGTYMDGEGTCAAEAPSDTFPGAVETAVKGCVTDAMKRALIFFGETFGLGFYDKRDGADAKRNAAPAANATPDEIVKFYADRFVASAPHSKLVALWDEVEKKHAALAGRLAKAAFLALIDTARSQEDMARVLGDKSVRLQPYAEVAKELRERALERWPKLPEKAEPEKPVADDRELDLKFGNPEVRFDPRGWKGDSMKGRKFSDCPADYLEQLADVFDTFAAKEEDDRKREYKVKDAARARGWAARARAKNAAPTGKAAA